ncbi:MAG: (4Fe-4S)-binding protein [Sphaerochaeta sp.]
MALTQRSIQELKGEGFLLNRGTETFSARIITGNGTLDCNTLTTLSHLAETFGEGKVSLTGRLTVEVPGIPAAKIPAFKEEIASHSLQTGGTGRKVRPVVACKGNTCIYGLANSQAIALEIHRQFYQGWHEITLPHKFKIAVGGCPNSCVKPELNDLGIVAQRVVHIAPGCKACKKCPVEIACPMGAIMKDAQGKRFIDRNICNNCSRCRDCCHFGKINTEVTRFSVYLGGRWGKQKRSGTKLKNLYQEQELFPLITAILTLFKNKGKSGERFASLVERLGMDYLEDLLHESL